MTFLQQVESSAKFLTLFFFFGEDFGEGLSERGILVGSNEVKE